MPLRITVNGTEREVSEQINVANLLVQLGMRPQQVAVEVNREIVPRKQHQFHVLAEGDSVEIATLVGGG